MSRSQATTLLLLVNSSQMSRSGVWGEAPLHRDWEPLGERVQRVLQREAEGRTAEPGELHDTEGGRDADWMVAMRQGTTRSYLHQDRPTGTAVLSVSAGAQVSSIRYYPYGDRRNSQGTLPDQQFTGQRLDGTACTTTMPGTIWSGTADLRDGEEQVRACGYESVRGPAAATPASEPANGSA